MINIPEINLAPAKTESKEVNYSDLEKELYVDISEEIKPQPIAISIGQHSYKSGTYPTAFGSYGDFSCVVGASKSKKTFLVSLMIACYIGGQAQNFASEIKGHDTTGKLILHFDTEQSQYHTQRVARRVIEMVGETYNDYKPYGLRKLSAKERLDFINYMVLESQYKDKIGLIVIDGVADLVDNINDVESSANATNSLLKWTAITNAHCITVLHRNFSSQKPTGHIGSFVLKKAETVVFVDNEDDGIKVNPEYTRNIPFTEFKFSVGNDWLPRVNEGTWH